MKKVHKFVKKVERTFDVKNAGKKKEPVKAAKKDFEQKKKNKDKDGYSSDFADQFQQQMKYYAANNLD